MRVFGFAGTGKTTMAKEIAQSISGPVHYMAFTGKAALVLRKKGCTGASTIHSAIYKPLEDDHGHTEFKWNPDGPLSCASLAVVDEVSMVGPDVGKDVLRYGTKVLVLGDPFQLQPVSGEGFFTNVEPDILLTEIHRQAADNPIIRMSMDIREGRGLSLGRYGDSDVVRRQDVDKEWLRERVLSADQLLCGKNTTRQTFNRRVRELKGMPDPSEDWKPVAGDRLVCLKNNNMKGLLNGGLWNVHQFVKYDGRKVTLLVDSLDDDKAPRTEVEVPYPFFTGSEKELDWRVRKQADEFTYGYALTVHKSQGSQWDDVLLFDESSIFRDQAAQHIYTAVTRAAEKVTVVV
jgi:exodeoxyribonuclease-5